MPLVVPGLQSKDGSDDKTSQWMNELVGKKIGDSHNETVRHLIPLPCSISFAKHANHLESDQTFAKADLPKDHRVIGPDSAYTTDYVPER